jgi:hypothetical protein
MWQHFTSAEGKSQNSKGTINAESMKILETSLVYK